MRLKFTIPKESVRRLMSEYTQLQISELAVLELTGTLELIVREVMKMANDLTRMEGRKRVNVMDVQMSEKRLKERWDSIV